MWIVKLALRRPYTFVVMALLIMILGGTAIVTMPVDIFPYIDIPILSIIYQYNGLSPEEMANRVVTGFERGLTTSVNDIEHIESQSYNGVAVIRVYFYPGARIELAQAQVVANAQANLRGMPPGMFPPSILKYDVSSVPVLQIGLGSTTMSESALFDYGNAFIRTQLATIQGATVPNPYGGKFRNIIADLDPDAMYAKQVSASDVSSAMAQQNLILPAGNAKFGDRDYQIKLNSSPRTVAELNDLPIKIVNGAPIYMKDVAQIRDGAAVQTSIVRVDGQKGALMVVMRNGRASTLAVVDKIKEAIKTRVIPQAPKELQLRQLADQSLFVRASINGVLREALIAACLTGLMILLFIGSWRSTIIVCISIPLSILVSLIVLSLTGQTINVMTLGGLALAVGILVDDATVEIENTHRNMAMKKPLVRAVLDGAQQIAAPAFVSTLCICVVFVPVLLLTGAARFLFTPLALAVVYAMMASYLLSRTLIPNMVHYLLRPEMKLYILGEHGETAGGKGLIWWMHYAFNRQFERLREFLYFAARSGARTPQDSPLRVHAVCARLAGAGSLHRQRLLPDGGFGTAAPARPNARGHATGTGGSGIRADRRRDSPRDSGERTGHGHRQYRPAERRLQSGFRRQSDAGNGRRRNSAFAQREADCFHRRISGPAAQASDGHVPGSEFLFRGGEHHEPDSEFRTALADRCADCRPEFGSGLCARAQAAGTDRAYSGGGGCACSSGGGLSRDPRECGSQQSGAGGALAERRREQSADFAQRHRPDRAGAMAELGYRRAVSDRRADAAKEDRFARCADADADRAGGQDRHFDGRDTRTRWGRRPTRPRWRTGIRARAPTRCSIFRTSLQRCVVWRRRSSIITTCSRFSMFTRTWIGRISGSVGTAVQKIMDEAAKTIPKSMTLDLRGQIATMQTSFYRLGLGLIFAIVLVYFLMALNFQSWLDPFIILTALPGALAGILWMLFVTQTTFSVPSLMGAIMCIGVATANSILVVVFANDQRLEGMDERAAALAAGSTRIRPVLMTAAAMIIGMLPMALGLGEGGEQNSPLGRAVIGGLILATVTTLFIVPVVYSLLRKKPPIDFDLRLEEEEREDVSSYLSA